MLNGRLKPYLAYSAAAHAGLILLLVLVLPDASSQPAATYHIISLQASPEIINRSPAAEMCVEFTSGDKSFDLVSLNAVRDSAPFPPPPPRYKDSFLNVHFEFKAQ